MTTVPVTGQFGPETFPVRSKKGVVVDAKWLTDNTEASYIIDPNTGKPYIVPRNYDPTATAVYFSNKLEDISTSPTLDDRGAATAQPSIYRELENAFRQGGWGDLQRPLADKSDVVEAFIPAANFAAAAGGVSAAEAVFFGGAYNVLKNGPLKLINNPLEFGNNPDNPSHIRDGADQFNQGILGVKYSENSTGSPDLQQTATNAAASNAFTPERIAPPTASYRPEQFDNRFGDGGSVAASASGDSGSPVLRALEKYRRSAAPDDLAPTSAQRALPATPSSQPYTASTGGVLGKFFLDSLMTPAEAASPVPQGAPLPTPYFPDQASTFGDRSGITPGVASPDTPLRRISSAFPGMALPGPDPVPPPEPGKPLGIFTGKLMPSRITPPPLGDLMNNSDAADNNDGFNLLAGLVSRSQTQPEPPQETAGNIPQRRLGRRILNRSPAPACDSGAAAAPLAPSVDANYSGGLLGMYAALAGTDPQDPNQPVPPDDAQEQADLQALEDRLTGTGNINDAWALYKARMASRRQEQALSCAVGRIVGIPTLSPGVQKPTPRNWPRAL
jgi:hypothetical protein